MSGSPSKRPRPSYEEGEARDPQVRKMLEEADRASGHHVPLIELLRRAIAAKAAR